MGSGERQRAGRRWAGANCDGSPRPDQQRDPPAASIARAYDYLLGGASDTPIDDASVATIMEALVEGGPFARINRAWHIRVTRFLAAEAELTQFLDLGSGLPIDKNTHQVHSAAVLRWGRRHCGGYRGGWSRRGTGAGLGGRDGVLGGPVLGVAAGAPGPGAELGPGSPGQWGGPRRVRAEAGAAVKRLRGLTPTHRSAPTPTEITD